MFWNNSHHLLSLMRTMLTVVPVLAAAPAAFSQVPVVRGPGQCQICHAGLADEVLSGPAKQWTNDRHARAGMGCADCHRGDLSMKNPEQAHDLAKGFIGTPDPSEIPQLCARCHGNPEFMKTENPALPVDQYEKYLTSRHGELLKMGLRKVAHCVSCHTAHDIRPASDPASSIYPRNLPRTCAHCHSDPLYMEGFPIPTDQFEKYSTSVHGRALLENEDLGAPACNDCHGNHGAAPPQTQSLAHVCGICHTLNAELFEKSPHAEPFAVQELPQCTVCHQHHAIAKPDPRIFNMEADSVCISCHRHEDPGWRDSKQMFTHVQTLFDLRERADAALDKAQNLGMDVSDGRFLLQDFHKNFLQLRTLSHELNLETYSETATEAEEQANAALQVAESAVEEFHFRRKGLLVSLLLCIPVALLLRAKIHQMDVGEPGGEESDK